MRKDPWPVPTDPEHLFTKAILIHGPLPGNGWSITRAANGRANYIVARGKEAKVFQQAVNAMFKDEIALRYAERGWTTNHHWMVAKSWKNRFYQWLWEQIDAE